MDFIEWKPNLGSIESTIESIGYQKIFLVKSLKFATLSAYQCRFSTIILRLLRLPKTLNIAYRIITHMIARHLFVILNINTFLRHIWILNKQKLKCHSMFIWLVEICNREFLKIQDAFIWQKSSNHFSTSITFKCHITIYEWFLLMCSSCSNLNFVECCWHNCTWKAQKGIKNSNSYNYYLLSEIPSNLTRNKIVEKSSKWFFTSNQHLKLSRYSQLMFFFVQDCFQKFFILLSLLLF